MALYIVLMTALFIAVFGGLASRFQKKMISEAELPIYKPNKEEFPEMLGLSSQLEVDLYADPSREDEHKLGLSKPKKNKPKLLAKKKTKPKKNKPKLLAKKKTKPKKKTGKK